MYSKRAGTSGTSGALYETKLLCLLSLRAFQDKDIENVQLVSNVDNIGRFNNICFKTKVEGFDKPVAVFIQAQHKEIEKQTHKIDSNEDDFDLATYFNSYKKLSDNDLFFGDTFDDVERLFIVYTNEKIDFSDDSVRSDFSDKLKHFIDTGSQIQLRKYEKNINCRIISMEDPVTSLAKRITKFIIDKQNSQMMMTDEHVLLYHVILAQKVFDVSEIQPNGYRIASFRYDFFDTNEKYLIIFKNTLFKEILKRRTIKPSDLTELFISEFLADPTDTRRLSKLIGTVIKYSNGQLEFDKQFKKDFRPDIRPIAVSQSTVNKAVKLAATEILLPLHFEVPAAFGNKDLTLRGSDAKKERRINYLASRILHLLDNCKFSKIVTIDESLDVGLLQLNGGIAGAIGNIFVLDDNTKLMKITDNEASLGNFASRLYQILNSKIHNLHEYKFSFKVVKFPKLSFGEYEENFLRDFLNKLLFYSTQADEKGVEKILKEIIDDYQRNQPNYFQVKTDAIFSEYHTMMQKWWMLPQQFDNLTRESNLLQHSMNNIIKDPLMSSINLTYTNKIQQYNYTFTEDAVRSLNLQDQHSSTVIVAENNVLTVVKVMQHLKNRHHVVLPLEYIANLPTNDRNALRSELASSTEAKVLILVCDKIDSRNEILTLEDIAEAVRSKTIIIIIANQTSLQIINGCFPEADYILHDKKLRLIDLSKDSQDSIIKTATATFPGGEISLNHLLRGWPKTGTRSVGPAVASAVAGKGIGAGSHGTGDEKEWNVPGKSQDP